MTDLHLPPHPGPPPRAFVFPFAQARAALAVGEALVQEILVLLDRHHEAAHTARHGFEGATRAAFDAGLSDLTARFEDQLAALRSDLGALEDDLALARRRQEASVDAIPATRPPCTPTGPPAPPDPSRRGCAPQDLPRPAPARGGPAEFSHLTVDRGDGRGPRRDDSLGSPTRAVTSSTSTATSATIRWRSPALGRDRVNRRGRDDLRRHDRDAGTLARDVEQLQAVPALTIGRSAGAR